MPYHLATPQEIGRYCAAAATPVSRRRVEAVDDNAKLERPVIQIDAPRHEHAGSELMAPLGAYRAVTMGALVVILVLVILRLM